VLVGQMCERLAARGHEVHLLTYGQGHAVGDRGFSHHRIRRLPGDDASRSGPRAVKPALDALLLRELVRVLGTAPFDVLHCHNYEAAVVGLAARVRRGVPVVYHSHNLMSDELATYFGSRGAQTVAGALGRLLDRTVPRAADHVIALCGYSAEALRDCGVSEDRLSVIAPAVQDEGPARPPVAARRGLHLADDAEVVGYCGNLDNYQNLELLLDGFAVLARERQARLLVVTHTPDARFSRALAVRNLQERTVVHAAATWADARSAMEACDVLVLPRRHGSGWPIKLLNYLSLGRPIVAAGCGAKILHDGVDALVTSDADAAALARTIGRLLADAALRRRLGDAGRARFLREFTWSALLPAVEDVYRFCRRPKTLPQSRMRYIVGERKP
jgi:glycosyltransferase involved in cell wall biosynthesis